LRSCFSFLISKGKLFRVPDDVDSNKDGTKVRSLKKNPDVYFLVDRRRSHNLVRYMGSLDSAEAKGRIETAKNNYSAIEITPLFIATWIS
jgi:hypothetical protein